MKKSDTEYFIVNSIKARVNDAVNDGIKEVSKFSKKHSLLHIFTHKLKLAAPYRYKQVNIEQTFRNQLKELQLISSHGAKAHNLVLYRHFKQANLSHFAEFKNIKHFVQFDQDIILGKNCLSADSMFEVKAIDEHKQQVELSSQNKSYDLFLNKSSIHDQITSFKIYIVQELEICLGDILFSSQQPEKCLMVTEIEKDTFTVIDEDENLSKVELNNGLVDMQYAYVKFADFAHHNVVDSTLIILEGEKDQLKEQKNFIDQVHACTKQLSIYMRYGKPERKLLQVNVPQKIKELIQNQEAGPGSYTENLIEKFCYYKAENMPEDAFLMLLSSPPFSTKYNIWVSIEHAELLEEYCERKNLAVNRMAVHLIFIDLIKRGEIEAVDFMA